MSNTEALGIYIVISLVIAYFAKDKGHGFIFYFVFSIVLSPVIAILLLLSAP